MGQNDFRKALEDVEEEERNKLAKGGQTDANKGKERNRDAETQVDLTLIKTDPDKLYPVIYYALKKTLAEWGEWMDQRPGMVFSHCWAYTNTPVSRKCQADQSRENRSSNTGPVG